jgi:hypothetical protein
VGVDKGVPCGFYALKWDQSSAGAIGLSARDVGNGTSNYVLEHKNFTCEKRL